jgi:hypothetical protein
MTEPGYTFEQVKEAMDFLMKWPNPLEIQAIEDEKERDETAEKYFHCLDIREWNKNHGERGTQL